MGKLHFKNGKHVRATSNEPTINKNNPNRIILEKMFGTMKLF